MADLCNKFVLKMKLHRVKIPVVYQCATLIGYLRRFGIDSQLKQGFIVFGDTCSKHYWVETAQGESLDVSTELGLKYNPELAAVQIRLETTEPENIQRVDLEEENRAVFIESQAHFDLYISDPKAFWDQRPLSVRNFKC